MLMLRKLVQLRSRSSGDDGEMSILEHLEELRSTIIRMILCILVAGILCFAFSSQVMDLLCLPANQVMTQQNQPEGIQEEELATAEEYCRISPLLTERQRTALLTELPAQARTLAQALTLHRAARLLPPEARAHFIREQAESPEVAETAAQLPENYTGKPTARRLMGVLHPAESFMLTLQTSFFCGLALSFPLLVFFLLRFIFPGLLEKERKVVLRSILIGSGLFAGGCAFAYFLVLPRVLDFFYSYSEGLGVENDWRIGFYLTFAAKLIFVFGAIFELPVIIMPLIRLGVLSYPVMKATRAYALIGCFAVALLLAPAPDPGTMIIMALPMYALYELCILAARVQGKRELSK